MTRSPACDANPTTIYICWGWLACFTRNCASSDGGMIYLRNKRVDHLQIEPARKIQRTSATEASGGIVLGRASSPVTIGMDQGTLVCILCLRVAVVRGVTTNRVCVGKKRVCHKRCSFGVAHLRQLRWPCYCRYWGYCYYEVLLIVYKLLTIVSTRAIKYCWSLIFQAGIH